jgi:hypothetical protein
MNVPCPIGACDGGGEESDDPAHGREVQLRGEVPLHPLQDPAGRTRDTSRLHQPRPVRQKDLGQPWSSSIHTHDEVLSSACLRTYSYWSGSSTPGSLLVGIRG